MSKPLDPSSITSAIKECLQTDSNVVNDIKQIVTNNDGDFTKSINRIAELLTIPITSIVTQRLEQLELKIDDLERRSRSHNLHFHGIKEEENPKEQIVEIAKCMNVELTKDDIEVAHFTGGVRDGKRGVIACFYSREMCMELLKKRKKLQQPQGRKYVVFEDCTQRTMGLYNKMRTKVSDAKKFHVYIRNGRVLYRSELKSKARLIETEKDIEEIINIVE
ncbi:unnamed protein product [Didymodactylos carnosus]|uniref:Uncharacterized protein n=1 Tax=Didymodactylos carnosus TaxID=1234261 RepID=A0A815XCY3_9BILA|nr:unnamed protein product [Didymodactylos carnosus]CAF4416893.1 unnamed protein product [Didymodactylos carnosus]